MKDKEKQFLEGLEKLTRETGITIGGCGCCGSPWLREYKELPSPGGYRISQMDIYPKVEWDDDDSDGVEVVE